MPKAIRIAALLLLALAIVLVIAAINLGRRTAATTPVANGSSAETVQPAFTAVTAGRALLAGTPVSSDDLATTKLPSARTGSFSSYSALAGAVPMRDIAAGEVITQDMLLQGIASQVRPGERAIAVSVDELIGVGNRVSPGDFVDVFMSLKEPDVQGALRQDNTQARLLLSRLRVLGYGSRDLTTASESTSVEPAASTAAPEPGSRAESISARSNSSGGNTRSSSPPAPARTAVLAVPVEQAGRLLLGAHSGKLFLALRNPGDVAVADESAFATPAQVLAIRRDLDPAEALTPENQAYAGIDLQALAGRNSRAASPSSNPPRSTRPVRAAVRPASGVEIIRGAHPATRLSSP